LPEETKVLLLQEQMNRVDQTLNQNPLIVFVTCIIGGISLAAGGYFGQPWLFAGLAIFCTCTSLSMFTARNAKEQFRKLVEQLNA
jgi:hypothetical protein